MILVEAEPIMPAAVEDAKTKVLAAFTTMHALQVFHSVEELAAFLDDEVLDGLAEAGFPRALCRVILFYRTPQAAQEVAKRMQPGGAFYAWQAPGCWLVLWERHGTQLRDWARRAEPNWQGDLPQGIL